MYSPIKINLFAVYVPQKCLDSTPHPPTPRRRCRPLWNFLFASGCDLATPLLFTGTLLVYSQLHQIARESDDAAEIFFLSKRVASRPPGRNEYRRYLHARAKREHHSDAAALSSRRPRVAGAAFLIPGRHISATSKHFEKVPTLCRLVCYRSLA